MHRFYLSPSDWNSPSPALTADESHHALDVLRLGAGDRIVVFDGEGSEATAQIATVEGKLLHLHLVQKTKTQPLSCALTLVQAIPKGKNMDFIIQKAVELGAARIVPLFSDRTVVHLDAAEAEKKRAKWREIAIEAANNAGKIVSGNRTAAFAEELL